MHYLKCGHCAEMTAMKSEYITFCEHCGKKFPLNYTDWKDRHPGGTFESFAEESGIPEIMYLKMKKKRQTGGFNLRGKAALITGMAVLIACGSLSAFYGRDLVKLFREPKVSLSLLEADSWRTFRSNNLRIQSPLSLSPLAVEDQPNMRCKAFKGGSYADGIMIRIDEAVYLSDAHIELEPAAAEVVRQMEKMPGITKFGFTARKVQVSGQEAVIHHGSYIMQETRPMEFDCLVVIKGGTRIQLLVTHAANDEAGRKVAWKIMETAVLN